MFGTQWIWNNFTVFKIFMSYYSNNVLRMCVNWSVNLVLKFANWVFHLPAIYRPLGSKTFDIKTVFWRNLLSRFEFQRPWKFYMKFAVNFTIFFSCISFSNGNETIADKSQNSLTDEQRILLEFSWTLSIDDDPEAFRSSKVKFWCHVTR